MKTAILGLLIFPAISLAAGTTSSFEAVMAQHTDTLEIKPVEFKGLPVEASPSTICVLAGYQIAVEFETTEFIDGTRHVDISTGWGMGSSVSGVDFKISHSEAKFLTRVLCKKKLPI